jgi:ribonuclease G
MAIPVQVGQVVNLFVEELHTYNPRNGIARIEGYVVDVDQGGMYVGQTLPVLITQVHRTYAKGHPNRPVKS